jgi:hypothetical protein
VAQGGKESSVVASAGSERNKTRESEAFFTVSTETARRMIGHSIGVQVVESSGVRFLTNCKPKV